MAFGNSGTRFKVFAQAGVPRDPFEKVADAAQVHRYTFGRPGLAQPALLRGRQRLRTPIALRLMKAKDAQRTSESAAPSPLEAVLFAVDSGSSAAAAEGVQVPWGRANPRSATSAVMDRLAYSLPASDHSHGVARLNE